jgi:hypothetical protein
VTWSFDDTLSTDKDKVRFNVGDTNTLEQLVTNEAIQVFLDAGDSVLSASVSVLRAILAKLGHSEIDRNAVGISSSVSQRVAQLKPVYDDLLARLKKEEREGYLPKPIWGGHSVADKASIETNTDYVSPPFYRGQHGNND